MTTLVYDIYSVESVITAALFRNSDMEMKATAFTATNFPKDDRYITVFVDNTNTVISKANYDTKNTKYEVKDIFNIFYLKTDTETELDDLETSIAGDILVNKKDRTISDYQLYLSLDFYLGRNKAAFKSYLKPVEFIKERLNYLATVEQNYQLALDCLNDNLVFEPIKGDSQVYLRELSRVKAKIKNFMVHGELKKNNGIYLFPILNTRAVEAIGAKRLLSRVYKNGFLYEIIGDSVIGTYWSDNESSFLTKVKQYFDKKYSFIFI